MAVWVFSEGDGGPLDTVSKLAVLGGDPLKEVMDSFTPAAPGLACPFLLAL